MTARLDALRQWAAGRHHLPPGALKLDVIADDASFRRYFRLTLPGGDTRVLMDAPPEHEDCRGFVEIASAWRAGGLPVPRLDNVDLDQGFIELQDLGDVMLRQRLQDEHCSDRHTDTWMLRAIALSVDIAAQGPDTLPDHDARWLEAELELFIAWCLPWLALEPPEQWPAVKGALIEAMTAQPQVTVHRDFHPQNLMCCEDRLWIIDFQGAVHGPATYDLASLLRDRNLAWPETAQSRWIEAWRIRAEHAGIIPSTRPDVFRRQLDLTATQRSLKVLGLFCRLASRDGKPRYLKLLPLFAEHVRQGLADEQFAAFMRWFETIFMPRLAERLDQLETEGSAVS